jgi:oxygen-independent coproporphyrinogen-3 oxidase
MEALADAGFNRCSMGIQDFEPKVQKAVNRIQPQDITEAALDWARDLHFNSINLDLMYGLPHQTTATFSDTIDKVIGMNPDRLAVFNYAHLPSMIKHQQLIHEEWLPTVDQKLELLKLSIEKLSRAGYIYIGMDHFARPDDELTIAMNNGTLYRNFQGYSTHAGINLLALGITSISMLSDLYIQNHKKMDDYYRSLDKNKLPAMRGVILNTEDQLRRDVITELMCNFRLSKVKFEQKYAISFNSHFSEALENLKTLEEDGLIKLTQEELIVTQTGRLLIRNIAMNFDEYLMKKQGEKPRFSRTV